MNRTPPPLLNYKLFNPEDENNQSEIPLIILHGLLGAQDNWRSQAKRLSTSRPVYTLDLRNHGHSPHIKGMSYREMYEDVIRVAQHEGIKQFHLLGHSMGGKVAMHLALANPELVKSLIIVDIAPKPYPLWHQQTLGSIMTAPIQTMQSRQEVDEHLKPMIEDESERRFMLKNLKRNSGENISSNTDDSTSDRTRNNTANNNMSNNKGFSWRVNLKEISRGYLKIAGFSTGIEKYTKNTLFVAGGLSPYIQEGDSTLINTLFPQASITTMESSGHLPHFQQADEFFHLVDKFLR